MRKLAADRLSSRANLPGIVVSAFLGVAFLGAASLIVSCSTEPVPPRPQSAAAVPSPPRATQAGEFPKGIPPETQAFLTELRSHIRRKDWAWAADRADPSFLRAMGGRERDSIFYMYLFSAAFLSGEASDESSPFKALPVSKVQDMVWDSESLQGPVAVIKGRFLLTQGDPIPFSLRVLWRLEPPRILGTEP